MAQAPTSAYQIPRDARVVNGGDNRFFRHLFARAPRALPQGRPLEHCAVCAGNTVRSTRGLHGKRNTTERKAECKIKGRRHGVFK